MVPLFDSSSESNQRAPAFQTRSKKLFKTSHQQPLSCGSLSRSLCCQPLPNSTISSTCVSWLEPSRVFCKLRNKVWWRPTGWEISNLNYIWLDYGDTNVNVYSVINWSTTKIKTLFSMPSTTFPSKALEWKVKSMISLVGISISSSLTLWHLTKEMKKEPLFPSDQEPMKPSLTLKLSGKEPTNVCRSSMLNLKIQRNWSLCCSMMLWSICWR